MKIYNLFIACALAASLAAPALRAQNGTMSPYSRFGYGLLNDQANAAQRAMGGVGIAQRSGREVNFMNPASYAAIDTLTFLFDMALDLKSLHSTEGDIKGKDFSGGLDYITLQFPVTKWGGMCIGLIPYSETGYKFGDEITHGQYSRQGSGELSQLMVGLSGRPLPGLTVGANISYLFGTLLNDTYVTATASGAQSLFERVIEVRDYNLRLGIQYGFPINRDHYLNFGAIYTPPKSMHGHTYGVKYDLTADAAPDTVGYTRMGGRYSVPATYGLGIAYTWSRGLFAELDFSYQPWKGVKYQALKDFDSASFTRFNNRFKLALGLTYQYNGRGNWLQRVSWRLGASLMRDYIRIGDNSLRERALTFGFGLPAPSSKSMVNLSFEFRHRQAHPQPLVKEDYFMATIGFNINELWFWRKKIR